MDHCLKVKGQILKCNKCDTTFTTQDVFMRALDSWRSAGSVVNHENELRWDHVKDAWIDAAAARYPFEEFNDDYNKDCASSWLFSKDSDVNQARASEGGGMEIRNKSRYSLLHHKYDEHDFMHRKSCFKKGSECRFRLCQTTTTNLLWVGDKPVYLEDDDRCFECLNVVEVEGAYVSKRSPFMVLTDRPVGSGELAFASFSALETNLPFLLCAVLQST